MRHTRPSKSVIPKAIVLLVACAVVGGFVYKFFVTPTHSDAAFESATVISIVDGDTLYVQTETTQGPQKVRLIGVDTPESVAPKSYLDKTGKENSEEGVSASDFVKTQISEGDTVFLEYDTNREDKYGRTLAYVWLEVPNNTRDTTEVATKMLNGILLANGYAEVMTVAPNVAYASIFAEIAG